MRTPARMNARPACARKRTHTRTPITFPLSVSPGKQSPASAAKLPKLSHLLMGYLSPCHCVCLTVYVNDLLLPVCLSVCLSVCLPASAPSWMSDVLSLCMLLVFFCPSLDCFCCLSAPVRLPASWFINSIRLLCWWVLSPVRTLGISRSSQRKYHRVLVCCTTLYIAFCIFRFSVLCRYLDRCI